MLNEWQEFWDYTGPVTYKADGKKDTAWLGRFTFEVLRKFGRLGRILTILARGFLFHGSEGEVLDGQPRERTDYARRGCVPGAVYRIERAQSRSGSIGRTSARSTGSSRRWWTRMAKAGSADTSTPP